LKDISIIEKIINWKSKEWSGHCHAVAYEILNSGIINGRLVYGQFLGNIHKNSVFFGNPFPHHGWIELENGDIFDPTRWSFEDKEPYVFIGKNTGEYDEGGDKLREALSVPKPKYDKSDKQKDIPKTFEAEIYRNLLGIPNGRNQTSISEIMWAANLSRKELGAIIKPIYQFIDSIGLSAFIPLDNKNLILK
jgi:hypothetical protein